MNRRQRAVLVCAFALVASRSDAQQERFADAVGELARRANGGAQLTPIEPLADRMADALAEWDSGLRTFERRVAAELRGAADERAFQLHVELGLAYRHRGRLADALREFDAAAARRPTASDVHVLRGLTFEAAERSDDAARAFQRAWNLDPLNPVKAYYAIASSTGADRQRAEQAIGAAYARSLTGAPGRRSSPFHTLGAISDTWSRTPIVGDAATSGAFALLAAGQYADAVVALRSAASGVEPRAHAGPIANESPLARFTRARGYEAESRVADARREYEAAVVGTLAGRSLLYIAIGRLAQVDGDLAGAIGAFRSAVKLNPNDPVVHRELAGALAADDRVGDAVTELAIAVLIDPSDASMLAAIGQLLLDSGRYADAIAPLTRTLQLAPDRYETHYALASALTHLGKTAAAARELERFERARRQMVEKRRRDIDSTLPGGLR